GKRRTGARDEIQVWQRGGQLADLRGGTGVVLQDGTAQRTPRVIDRDDGGNHARGRDGGDVGGGDGPPRGDGRRREHGGHERGEVRPPLRRVRFRPAGVRRGKRHGL